MGKLVGAVLTVVLAICAVADEQKATARSIAPLVGMGLQLERERLEWFQDQKLCLMMTLNGVRIIDNQPIGDVTPSVMDGDEFVPGPILLQGDHSNASFKT